MDAQITLKSGAQITFQVDEITTSRLTGGSRSLKWETPEDWKVKLLSVDASEIVAIVVLK